jgi:hypothetical protein
LDRFKIGYRGDGACSAYLEIDTQKEGLGLFGLKLIGDGPAGRFGSKSKFLLLGNGIHLDHHSIDLERKLRPGRFPVGEVIKHLFQAFCNLPVRRDLESHWTLFEALVMKLQVAARQEFIKTIQRPRCDQRGILHLEGT